MAGDVMEGQWVLKFTVVMVAQLYDYIKSH